MPDIGQTVAHYRIIEKTGAGGMGVVFKARGLHLLDPATGKESTAVALEKPGIMLTVSSDAAYVVWAQMDRKSVDLMLVDDFL